MCEPLRDKIEQVYDMQKKDGSVFRFIRPKNLKSAVEGLIKYHEGIIEDLIENVSQRTDEDCYTRLMLNMIESEYYSLQVIEHWLEDAIEIENRCRTCGCPESFHRLETDGDQDVYSVCKKCGVCS